MPDLLSAADKRIGYALNELESDDPQDAIPHLRKAREFVQRAQSALVSDDDPVTDDGYVIGKDDDDTQLTEQYTVGQAVQWWRDHVFPGEVNVSKVRPELLPGSGVLTAEGKAKARELAVSGTNIAPNDYNPIGVTE